MLFFAILLFISLCVIAVIGTVWYMRKFLRDQKIERAIEEFVIETLGDHKGSGKIKERDLIALMTKSFPVSEKKAKFILRNRLLPGEIVKEVELNGAEYLILVHI